MNVDNSDATGDQGQSHASQDQPDVTITTSPSPDPTSIAHPSNASSSDYPITGLDVLQAASDAAQALQDVQGQTAELASSAVAAVAAVNAQAQDQTIDDSDDHIMMSVGEATTHDGSIMVTLPQLSQEIDLDNDSSLKTIHDQSVNSKRTRLSRACDGCSLRKVKCDATGPPCSPCRDLSIACTMQRPKKRRGPPNRSLEVLMASKKLRPAGAGELVSESVHLPPSFRHVSPPAGRFTQEPQIGHSVESPELVSSHSSPHHPQRPVNMISASPNNAATALVAFAANDSESSLEDIAPLQIITAFVDDYFTYVYPLIPFPHEPTFRHAFASREDQHRPEFLALVASMVGAVVASYPRSLRQQMQNSHGSPLPHGNLLVETCRRVVLETRGSKWILKNTKTTDDAATSFLLGLSAGHLSQWNICQYFTTEALTLMKELGFQGSKVHDVGPTFESSGLVTTALPSNLIREQIGLRMFWALLIGARSLSQMGGSRLDLIIPPPTSQFPYPAFPELVSDNQIQANEIIDGGGAATLLSAFRLTMDTYYTMNGIVSAELAYGINTLGWSDQRNLLKEALLAAKGIVERLPPELQVRWSEGSIGWDGSESRLVNGGRLPQSVRRQLQFDIQRVNICGSQLATRSYYVDLYFHLLDIHLTSRGRILEDGTIVPGEAPLSDEEEEKAVCGLMVAERDQVVDELVSFIYSVSPFILEPNAGNLIKKLRQAAMIALAGNPKRKGPMAKVAEEVLLASVEALDRLSRSSQVTGEQGEDLEEAILQAWADVRRLASRFWEDKCKIEGGVPEAVSIMDVRSDGVDTTMGRA